MKSNHEEAGLGPNGQGASTMKKCLVSSTSSKLIITCAIVMGGLQSVFAANITGFTAPDAWTRGDANTTYYGWDIFESGAGTFLNDVSPDITPLTTGVSIVQNNNDVPNVTGSGNLYTSVSFLDVTALVKTDGTLGSGFTTVLLQIAGSSFGPGQTAAGFDGNSFTINGLSPDFLTDGYGADNRNLWWAEWVLTGNQATYTLEMDTVTQHTSVSKLTIDTAWHPSAGLDNSDVTVVPEPASTALLIGAGALLGLRRRRK